MLAKLLSLLLHAKSGAISGVLLLGATGALVSVSASNGVTTITITEASPSPVSLVSHTTEKAVETETKTPPPPASPKLSSATSSTACTDEATALATQVERVNSAFSTFHTDLMKLKGLRAADVLAKADATLKAVRQGAVKAIHATATQACAKQDDEAANETDTNTDTDNEQTGENDTDDATSVVGAAAPTTTSVGTDESNDNNNDGDHGTATVAPVTFTGTASEIADQAFTAMKVAFDAANSAPVVAAKPAKAPEQKTNSTNKTSGSEHHD